MSKRKGTDFSRIHPAEDSSVRPERAAPQDQDGRRALFSPGTALPEEAGSSGMVSISCGHCGDETSLSPEANVRVSVAPPVELYTEAGRPDSSTLTL